MSYTNWYYLLHCSKKKFCYIYSAACWNKFKSSLYMHRDFYTDYLFYYKSSTCVPCIFWIILLYIN